MLESKQTRQQRPDVPYHRQDNEVKCAAACAQMVLASIGAGIVDQQLLLEIGQSVTGNKDLKPEDEMPFIGMSPEGLAKALNESAAKRLAKDVGARIRFQNLVFHDREAADRRICWDLDQGRPAPIALCDDGRHYVVVTDFKSNRKPSGPADTELVIESFNIKDPSPALASAQAPKPHANGDSCQPEKHLNPLDYEEWAKYFTWLPGVEGEHEYHLVLVSETRVKG